MTSAILTFAGGIGLFLLGMRLMTDGLTIAAGDTLRGVLASATRSPLRGVASGLLITTTVQSSSAVIFATIGFVNAGLLSLRQAIGIVYGANLGTTLTSWLVALAGFNLNLRALALPAIGMGALLWALSGQSRRGALGQAIAGFGLFFLGIDVLKDAFEGIGATMALHGSSGDGVAGMFAFVGIGVLLTLLTQSSSATLAITLTAAAGGLLPLQAAAAMVIGANVGTTSTAIFAAFGATSPAKRVATAHVVFNIVTAAAALILLPVLLWLARGISGVIDAGSEIALTLAVFHTLTKLLGIGLIWPLTPRFVDALERRFHAAEDDPAQPRYLDGNVLASPALAIDALGMELRRMNGIAQGLSTAVLADAKDRKHRLDDDRRTLDSLQAAIGTFAAGIHQHDKDPEVSGKLPDALRIAQYHVNMGEQAQELARLRPHAHLEVEAPAQALAQLRREAAGLLDSLRQDTDQEAIHAGHAAFEHCYQTFKTTVLRAGTTGEVAPQRMAAVLEYGSSLRRLCDQAFKAALYLLDFPGPRSPADIGMPGDAPPDRIRTDPGDPWRPGRE